MTRYWTAFNVAVRCDSAYGPHDIPALEPVRVISPAIRQCELHAAVDVDWPAVDKARHRLEAVRAAAAAPASPTRPVRMPVVRQLQPLSAIAADLPFDPRAAAAGDRD